MAEQKWRISKERPIGFPHPVHICEFTDRIDIWNHARNGVYLIPYEPDPFKDGDPNDPDLRPNQMAERIATLLNLAEGIPTEELQGAHIARHEPGFQVFTRALGGAAEKQRG